MRTGKWAAAALAVAAGLASNVAMASPDANSRDCQEAARQVKSALAGKDQTAEYDAAVKERNHGRDFCSHGMYRIGVGHYNAALRILGVSNG